MFDDDGLDDLGLTGVLVPFAETSLLPHRRDLHDSLKGGYEYPSRPVIEPIPRDDLHNWVQGPNSSLVPPPRKAVVFYARMIGPIENQKEESTTVQYQIPSEIATTPRIPKMMLRTPRNEMIEVTPRGLTGKNGLAQKKFVTAGDVQLAVADWMRHQEQKDPRDDSRHDIVTGTMDVDVNGTMTPAKVYLWRGLVQDLEFKDVWRLCL